MNGPRRSARPALMLLAAAVALAGCGADDGSGEAAEEEGIGIVRAGSTAQFADCGDWRKGTEEQRYVTIAEIRGQLTPQSSETAESDLSDAQAYEIFQSACEAEGSDKLRLYKLYARAQAFAPLTPDP